MVGLTDTFVANGAGHSVGDTVPPSRLYGSVFGESGGASYACGSYAALQLLVGGEVPS